MPDSMIADAKRRLTEQGRRMPPKATAAEEKATAAEEKARYSPECEAVCPGFPAVMKQMDADVAEMAKSKAATTAEELISTIYGPICDKHQEVAKCSMREAACQEALEEGEKAPSDDDLKKQVAELDEMCSGIACTKACPKVADMEKQTDEMKGLMFMCENKINDCVAAEPSCSSIVFTEETPASMNPNARAIFTEGTPASMNLQCKYFANGCQEKMVSKEMQDCQVKAVEPEKEAGCDDWWDATEPAGDNKTVCCKARKDMLACGGGCMKTMFAMTMAKNDNEANEEMKKNIQKTSNVCGDVGISVAELEAEVEDAEAESSPKATADGAVVNTISVTAILVSLLTLAKTM